MRRSPDIGVGLLSSVMVIAIVYLASHTDRISALGLWLSGVAIAAVYILALSVLVSTHRDTSNSSDASWPERENL